MACVAAIPLQAGAARFSVDMPAERLESRLLRISRLANVELAYTDPAIAHAAAPAIRGQYSLSSLVRASLAGSGYTFKLTASFIAVTRAAPKAAHVELRTDATVPVAPGSVPEEIVILGSGIDRAPAAGSLPKTVIGKEWIGASGATTGDDLLRTVPQFGDVAFNRSFVANSSNSARGDVASLDLRSLGVGNTLLLVDGYRVATHPTSQGTTGSFVPTSTSNVQAIPVLGLQRMEILKDGASAIYGSDAIAGAVDAVLLKNLVGARAEARYGLAEGTGLRQANLAVVIGRDFAAGRGNITVFGENDRQTLLAASDQAFTASEDRRSLFKDTRFAGAASLDGRRTFTPWGNFSLLGSSTVQADGRALTSSTGDFHIAPQGRNGYAVSFSNGTCLAAGAPAYSGGDRDLRFDQYASTDTTILPKIRRGNFYVTSRFDVTPDIQIFGQGSLYLSRTYSVQPPVETSPTSPIIVPASNYWNPFGPVLLPDGSLNPNRLPGLVGVPAAGLPVTIRSYAFVDAGPSIVRVAESQYRVLSGVRFSLLGFRWELATFYSAAHARDSSDGISKTLLQRQLSLSNPSAYNPFDGGTPDNPSIGDANPSSKAALDAIRIRAVRSDRTTLADVNLRAQQPHLLNLPAGPLGVALGAEVRRESVFDNRDPHVDGTITYTDQVSGILNASDLMGTSASADIRGARTIGAVYAEVAAALLSPEMDIPFVRKVDVQFAGRFEDYSDVGQIAEPKIALSWVTGPLIKFHASLSGGFRAPEVEQLRLSSISRTSIQTDYSRCGQDLAAKRITSFAACTQILSVADETAGNKRLRPETSRNWTIGATFTPDLGGGRLELSLDYWSIRQKRVIGTLGASNQLALDYLARSAGGTNSDVVRAAPTAAQIAAAAGTPYAPIGDIIVVTDRLSNLTPQRSSGIDFRVTWSVRGPIGDLALGADAAYLHSISQSAVGLVQSLLAARDAGTINPATPVRGFGELVGQDGRPRWKASSWLTWKSGPCELGAFVQYTGPTRETNLADASGSWREPALLVGNLYAQWALSHRGQERAWVRAGVRNITNAAPPADAAGFLASLYNPYRRYVYFDVRTKF